MVALGSVWHPGGHFGLTTGWLGLPRQTAQIVLAASAAWIAWKGRGGDLVEPRRRARFAYVLLTSLFMINITGTYIAPEVPSALVVDLNVLRMFLMAVGLGLLISGLRAREMFAISGAAAPASTGADESVAASTGLAEARLLTRLHHLMKAERAYRQEGLTIGALASRVGVPEYVLRRLINGRLGYRNFPAYLNGWRLAEAEAALQDPAQRAVPISNIALDAGFSSLGPFNRAFKASEGVTPTELRDRAPAPVPLDTASPKLKSA